MELLNSVFTNEIKIYIAKIKEEYLLSNYEYVNLIALIITNTIITRENINIDAINYFIELILNKRGKGFPNDNSYVYHNSIDYIVKSYFNKHGISEETFKTIIKNWFNGYIFHSLNDCFVEEINNNGFILENKPWDINDIQDIKKIFKGIFGTSNGEDNIVFFSTSLATSPYYGLSSPTFYRKFIENKPELLNIYLNRNLISSHQSIENLCEEHFLDEITTAKVLSFFKKYWLLFTNNKLPTIILKKRMATIDIPYPNDDIVTKVSNLIKKDNSNIIIRNNISRDDLIIFSYDSLSIIDNKTKKLDI